MHLNWRPMEARDVANCAAIITSHPVIGSRYGARATDLDAAWMRLLHTEAMTTAVFEETDISGVRLAGVGVGVFVSDEFIHEIKTSPQAWVGPLLVDRVLRGNSPVLTDQEVRAANSGSGLNELVWETLCAPGYEVRTEIYHLMGNAYIEIHRGFCLKEMITSQAESPERLQWALDAGGMYWDPKAGRYVKSPQGGTKKATATPHIVGITRELEFSRPGSWVGSLFAFQPPRCMFSTSERRLLTCAISNPFATNPVLARRLGTSLPTVKKTWLSIYDRVSEHVPDLLSDTTSVGARRGKEKRRRLLAYLQEHPEELRPTARQRTLSPSRQISRS